MGYIFLMIERFEDVFDLCSCMCVPYLSCSQFEESFKGQSSGVGGIQIADEVVDKFVACCESKSYKCIFEFNGIDYSATITIKNVKSFLDLSDLISCSIVRDVIFGSPWFGHVFGLIFGVGGCFLGVVLYWFVFGCAHLIQNNKDQSKFLLISSTYAYKYILSITLKHLQYIIHIKSERVQLDLSAVIIQKLLMIKSRISVERENHINMLIYALRLASEKLSTVHVYFEQRAHEIVTTILGESDIFGTGLTQIYQHNHPPQADIHRVVLVAVLSDSAITQIERYLHLFKEIFIVNLCISGSDIKQSMKVSPIRLKTKGFYEINLNFLPFIDSVYYASNVKREPKTEEQVSFQQSLTSFLISLPRFHEFQIQLLDKFSGEQLGNSIKTLLQSKLRVLQKHNSKEYSSQSSPRLKVLVLERKIDQMSPLLYSYYYGPISKQIQAFDRKNHKFTSKSALYHALFSLDIQQAGDLLSKLSQQKSNSQKMRYQLNEFDKAKKAISSQYDESTSTEELKIQIEALNSAKEFCKRRVATTALQQTIVNGLSEECLKMSAGRVVDRIVEWSDIPLQDLKPSQEDYMRILILSYMVNSFWFWHRRIINAGIQGPHKEKVISFCKKIQGKFAPLKQKAQGEQRLDLYRHQPAIVSTVKNWILKPQSSNLIKFGINGSSINRQSKIVIAINGPLGYGQLAMLMSELKKVDKGQQYIIFSESLMTTKEYLSLLLGHQK